jgi:hypothetical protein
MLVDPRPHLGPLGREVEAADDHILALGPPRDAAPGDERPSTVCSAAKGSQPPTFTRPFIVRRTLP